MTKHIFGENYSFFKQRITIVRSSLFKFSALSTTNCSSGFSDIIVATSAPLTDTDR